MFNYIVTKITKKKITASRIYKKQSFWFKGHLLIFTLNLNTFFKYSYLLNVP